MIEKEKYCFLKYVNEKENIAVEVLRLLIAGDYIISGHIDKIHSFHKIGNEVYEEDEYELTCFTEIHKYKKLKENIKKFGMDYEKIDQLKCVNISELYLQENPDPTKWRPSVIPH